MGFLRTDYSEVGGFGTLPEGLYECIISEVKMTKTSASEDMIKVTLTIREDVEQEGKKRKIFDNLLIRDTMMWKIQQISKAAQLPVGEDYETSEDFMNALRYKAIAVQTKNEEYQGQTNAKVKFYTEAGFEGGGAPEGGTIDVTDDQLPF